jgi:predicted amidohydrolase
MHRLKLWQNKLFYALLLVILMLTLPVVLAACGDNSTVSPATAPAFLPTLTPSAGNTTIQATPANTTDIQTAALATTAAPLVTAATDTATTPPSTTIANTTTTISASATNSANTGKIVYTTLDNQIFSMDPDGSTKTKIADGSSAIVSADGKRVAFVLNNPDETSSVISVNIDGSGKQELCKGAARYVINLVRWSPSGRFIALTYDDSSQSGNPQGLIELCNTDSKTLQKVQRSQGAPKWVYDWTPDGNYTIWESLGQDNYYNLYYGDPDKNGAGAVVIAKGKTQQNTGSELQDFQADRFSPDGKTIASISENDNQIVFYSTPGQTSPLAGKTISLPSDGSQRAYQLTWSPEGNTLAAWVVEETVIKGTLKLYKLSPDHFGEVSQNLADNIVSVDWSRASSTKPPVNATITIPVAVVAKNAGKIVYTTMDQQVFLINPDGTGKIKIADGRNAIISADGKQVAFVTGADMEKNTVVTINIDGSNKQELCSGEPRYGITLEKWSPSGRFIALAYYPSHSDASYTIELCNPATKTLQKIERSQGAPIGVYDWTPDGNYTIWQSYTKDFYFNLYYGDPDKNGAGAVLIAKGKTPDNAGLPTPDFYDARFSPDGKTIAVIKNNQIVFYPTPSQKSSLLDKTINFPNDGSQTPTHLVWSPDGNILAVLVYDQAGNKTTIQLYSLSPDHFGEVSQSLDNEGKNDIQNVDWSSR